METPEGEVTTLLHAWSSGDRSVEDRLFELVLPDLRKLAERMMRGERPDHSLQPTALLNEVRQAGSKLQRRGAISDRHGIELAVLVNVPAEPDRRDEI